MSHFFTNYIIITFSLGNKCKDDTKIFLNKITSVIMFKKDIRKYIFLLRLGLVLCINSFNIKFFFFFLLVQIVRNSINAKGDPKRSVLQECGI